MTITDYHAKYYAHELSKRCASGDLQKLTSVLVDAQVDLNPHQIEAALFAFKSPLSKGALLADEVGLGKTIEAGILLSQKWAEGKRRILIICPSSLRKQWSRELQEKFFLPSSILESANFNKSIKAGSRNPFDIPEIVLCSFQFAANRAEYLIKGAWDLVVIDEAHRLRNVYKKANKIARTLRTALASTPKVLLTATPLQNSLLELYGLVSFIDEYAFGDLKSFKQRYARLSTEDTFSDLKNRLAPLCHRTLRSQVLEYIKYTNRVPITQEFTPLSDEQTLYEMVSEYLQRDNLQALPPSQRSLMTLVLRKLLASSTFAIAGALNSMSCRLQRRLADDQSIKDTIEVHADIADDFETLNELIDEWEEEVTADDLLTDRDIEALKAEIEELVAFRDLAISITENAKGQSLLLGLEQGFKKAREIGSAQKAVIFTESRLTQNYLLKLLGETEYAGKIVLFNGSNTDPHSREVYTKWKERHQGTDLITGSRTADLRAALVEYFKNEAQIMIATEAAAEGINLQFCSLVVNYDLPWNPQRIEQRIGRCHRYGQKHDVVVVNFLNRSNAADQRVFELLDQKFKLFSGVFGASDEVLGVIESGVDFEKRIIGIYQRCRTTDAIQTEFDFLRQEMDEQISEAMNQTRQRLLENFDAEVHEKLKVNLEQSSEYLNRYETLLWELTRHQLEGSARFFDEEPSFTLDSQPYTDFDAPTGRYRMGKEIDDAHLYRLGTPLAQRIIHDSAGKSLPSSQLDFRYTDSRLTIASLESLVGSSGTLTLRKITIASAETQDHLYWAARTDKGQILVNDQCHRLFTLPASVQSATLTEPDVNDLARENRQCILDRVSEQNANFFEEEMDKLERWADDRKASLEIQIRELDQEIKQLKVDSRKLRKLEEKIKTQRHVKQLEQRRTEFRRRLFEAQDEIEQNKDELLDEVSKRLEQTVQDEELFTIRWTLT